MRARWCTWILCFVVVFSVLCELFADDWPMWGRDAGRQGQMQTELPETLDLHWVRQKLPPRRAWPPQGDDGDKLEFDRSYEPIVLGDKVFVGSMVADRLTAYDLATGRELWRDYSDGPIRLAPAAGDGRVLVVSDDGHLVCLDAESGQRLWRFQAAPTGQRVLGNARMISMWPARGAPLLLDGIVYFGAGIWPMHGTFVYALQADTGEVVWSNTGDGTTWAAQPHGGAYAFAALAPQGYLAAAGDRLVVSGGRTPPVLLDRDTGELLHINLRAKPHGGYRVRTDGEFYYNHGRRYRLNDGQDEGGGDLADAALAARAAEVRDQLDSPIHAVVAARQRLLITTTAGTLYCFGAPQEAEPETHQAVTRTARITDDAAGERAEAILAETGIRDGYALWVGVGEEDLAVIEQLVLRSDLHVVGIDPAEERLPDLRRQLDDAGLYGTRVALLPFLPGQLSQQYPPYVSSLIVVSDPAMLDGGAGEEPHDVFFSTAQLAELYDMLRPYGGQALLQTVQGSLETPAARQAAAAWEPAHGRIEIVGNQVRLIREGAIPDTDDWTHQYSDSANTVFSRDQVVRLPLGLLWFGGPGNDDILPRHGHGPIPQVAAGRVILPGVDSLSARDVYTGRTLWQTEFPGLGHPFTDLEFEAQYQQGRSVFMHTRDGLGANYIGSPFVSLPDTIYVRYRTRILCLDPESGAIREQYMLPVADEDRDAADWGHLSVWEDLVITTVEPHVFEEDGLGTRFPRMADIKGRDWNATSSRRLVVLDRHRGEVLWTRAADVGFRHNAVVTAAGRMFVIDGLSDQALEALARRGREPDSPTILALDARTGEELWRTTNGVFGTWLGYSEEHDVLLQAGRRGGLRDLPDEPNSRITALRGQDGAPLWQRSVRYAGPLALRDRTVILAITARSGQNRALDLLTGQDRQRRHPLTDEPQPWFYWRTYGCNTINASQNLLLFRSGAAGFADLESDGGTGSFGGFRSGCTNNLIPANGVLNAPDYTRTCSCSYHQQTSLAMIHMPHMDVWTANPLGRSNRPIARVGINLGAPGNRRAEDGTLWVETPPGGAPGPELDVRVQPDTVDWYRKHGLLIQASEGPSWVAASGGEGVTAIEIGNLEHARYRVRLHFAEPRLEEAGQRVFDVLLQGETVLENWDLVQAAGGPDRGLVRQFTVDAEGTLDIALRPVSESSAPPVISGIELLTTEATVATLPVSAIARRAATLAGDVARVEHADSVAAFFRWREAGAAEWAETPPQTIRQSGPFHAALDDLQFETRYEFQAVAKVDQRTITGETRTFVPSDRYALAFDNHYVHVPHHPALNPGSDSFTFEAWARLESAGDAGDGWDLILAKRSPNGYYVGMRRGHGWNFMLRDDQGQRTDTQADRPIAEIYDRWVFVQAVVDRQEDRQILRVYDPGSDTWHEASVTPPGAIGTTDDLFLGKDGDAGRFQICGDLGPVRFWRTARTAAQALQDMHEPLSAQEPHLTAYWSMREGQGNRLNELSESGNHGSIVGATWTTRMLPVAEEP